ncbi:hypothetical protein [Undibacterium oligocarboniphilum]|uniref:Uncharacterized protein n=1 Tax=Undibacterium oligocarboniphilum TaxID=666702 RepID=A0A850QGN6_9BURK|nr:hypothetical protein [Undibacterium oligocarboniphilum]MBC3870750.1 hypothetical protein [Undibacterium oligocarboniphilum]NVO78448.1 hypothetical protein [Undibacterium oligocarboniphilum]
MVFNWFDAKDEKLFGSSLADFYLERHKTEVVNKNNKYVERKQKELFVKLLQQLEGFKAKHKLNFYKKAQLGNAFKWRLIESGLSAEQVNQLTSWLTRQL